MNKHQQSKAREYFPSNNPNKKILETDYPRGEPLGYPAGLISASSMHRILAEEDKTEILYFASPRTGENSGSDLSQSGALSLPKGEVNRKPRPKGRRIFRF